MNRFLYYLVFLNMMAIITTPIPSLLLIGAHGGAIPTMVLGLFTGMLISFFFLKFFNKFPGRDYTELLKAYTSNYLRVPVTIYFAIVWYLAGTITLVMLTFLLITFLTPEMSIYLIAISILITVAFGVLLKSKSVLFAVEIIVFLVVPIAFFLFIKLYSSSELDWDQVRTSLMYSNSVPKYGVFTATLFSFSGIANLIVFNRYFTKRNTNHLGAVLIIGLFGVFTLVTTYFIPIGLNGFDQVDRLIFPWTSAADSVRMKYGIVERAVFLFMLFFVAISFMSITVHWHVSYKLIQSLIRIDKLQMRNNNWTPFLTVAVFVAVAIYLTVWLTQYQLYTYSAYYFNAIPIFIIVWAVTMFAVKRGHDNEPLA
ncbi:hypothetical protein NCCP2716_23080 [Sporosarcina sp. NCCP-2716]|uniref:GerAB/ArcD/ProY family transporter n=1 Tax=Sporosarcina sp. NCCP-2716 TaxID=2943679 RepID=UPI00203A63DB|nr:GerAB/ArcD/ProY family transporter [Sporosarcina sp. NCCP-2716]GKV69810.1 hypothetical protein NCCP2716_23080 [Sporosarcina sp. NCCP-2716]